MHDGPILLDTCVLIPFFMDWVEDQRCTQTTLKKLILLGAKPQVHHGVIMELRRALKRKWSNSMDEFTVINRINDFIPADLLQVIKVPNKVRRHLHYEKKEDGYEDGPLARLSLIDRQLTVHSMLQGVPVFTYDKQILNAMGQSPISISLPTPFDDAAIAEITFSDITRMSPSMRGILQSSIQELKNSMSKLNDAQDEHRQIKELADKLDCKIRDLMSQKAELMDLVRPDLGEAALWTSIEIALGFIPIPIPTTPVTTIIQSRKLAKLVDKWGNSTSGDNLQGNTEAST